MARILTVWALRLDLSLADVSYILYKYNYLIKWENQFVQVSRSVVPGV
jgi:hypothetical protein